MQWFKRISHLNGFKCLVDVNCGLKDGRKTGHLYRTLLKQVRQKVKNYLIPFTKQNSLKRSGVNVPQFVFSELIDVAK